MQKTHEVVEQFKKKGGFMPKQKHSLFWNFWDYLTLENWPVEKKPEQRMMELLQAQKLYNPEKKYHIPGDPSGPFKILHVCPKKRDEIYSEVRRKGANACLLRVRVKYEKPMKNREEEGIITTFSFDSFRLKVRTYVPPKKKTTKK